MNSPSHTRFDPDVAPANVGVYGLPTPPDEAALILIPVPWEVSVSYRTGASRGPEAILKASLQVEVYDLEVGTPYESGIAMVEPPVEIKELIRLAEDARNHGRLSEFDELCAAMGKAVFRETQTWHEKDKLVGLVGGEHGIALGAIKHAAREAGTLGILQIDAHADLRESYQEMRFSHACFVSNLLTEVPGIARVVQVGVRDCCPAEVKRIDREDRITTFFDNEDTDLDLQDVIELLPECVWITLDIDGLDPSLCPNTGTPVPGGLSWRGITRLLRLLAGSGRRIVGFDLCEVAPGSGVTPGEGWDENVGARLLYKLCGWTLQTNGHNCPRQ